MRLEKAPKLTKNSFINSLYSWRKRPEQHAIECEIFSISLFQNPHSLLGHWEENPKCIQGRLPLDSWTISIPSALTRGGFEGLFVFSSTRLVFSAPHLSQTRLALSLTVFCQFTSTFILFGTLQASRCCSI